MGYRLTNTGNAKTGAIGSNRIKAKTWTTG